jgi:hypothetical protein
MVAALASGVGADDEANRLERAAAELIVQRLKPRGES